MDDTNKIAESDDLETEEEAYIKETKRTIKQLESIIFKRNQNVIISSLIMTTNVQLTTDKQV